MLKDVMEMRQHYYKNRMVLYLPTLCIAILGTLSGCAAVGPSSINMGRGNYNEAINKTEDEQMLLSIVKERYGETSSLLAVSGVAANVRFRTNANIEVGWGPKRNYVGELVPFSGGVAYEENPTITYSPVISDQYLRQLMSPMPLDIMVLFVRTEMTSAELLSILANRINDMQNPGFINASSPEIDTRFQRFVELNAELNQAGVIQWVADPAKKEAFCVLITGHAPDYSAVVREYLGLLGRLMPTDETQDIVLPVYSGVKGRELDGIAISTRSVFDLIQILRGAIDIPQEHVSAGIVYPYPAVGPVGQGIRIHTSKYKPKRTAVAVAYRDYWFYIDDTDVRTKMFYFMVRTLWSISMASAADQGAAPVLTIPIGQ
jgi:hypothetical protein